MPEQRSVRNGALSAAGGPTADDRPAWFSYTAGEDRIALSPRLCGMLGDPHLGGEAGRHVLARVVHQDDHAEVLTAITKVWSTRSTVRTTVRLMRADGGWFDVDCRLEPIRDPDDTVLGIRGLVVDVSARERARRETDRMARRDETVQDSLAVPDPATGLLTRARFTDEIDRAQRRCGGAILVIRVQPKRAESATAVGRPQRSESVAVGGRPDRPGAAADGRPDHVNDLLHRAARVLEGVVRDSAVLGRVGISEIGLLLPGTSWPTARREAELLVEALRAQTFVLPERWLRAEAWGGLVRFTPDAEAGSHEVLIDAEQAWRQSREQDRPLTLVAHPVPSRDRQGSYRSRVADALGTDRFTLYSQPILELQSNTITRHELLLRVLDEADGPQSPAQVLDTAERLDAVFDIDLWVIERAMQLAAEQPDVCLQVNLSGRSVGDPRLTDEVERLITQYDIRPGQLTFEITETALIGNLLEARRFADRVRHLGCELALDDFGSGYASFRYLRIFPIDLVKIDGEYVVNLVANPQDQTLVSALVQVCQAYGIRTVAEFVQDEPTLRMLRALGVDMVQGYLIGRPAPLPPPGRLPRS